MRLLSTKEAYYLLIKAVNEGVVREGKNWAKIRFMLKQGETFKNQEYRGNKMLFSRNLNLCSINITRGRSLEVWHSFENLI